MGKYFSESEVTNGQTLLNNLVWRVVNDKENIIMFIVGPTGRGKSYAGIRIMELLQREVMRRLVEIKDPYAKKYVKRVEIDQVCVAGKEFMACINKPAPLYSTVLFDEVGVSVGGIAARRWQSDMNQAIFDIVQTFRNMGLFTIFTAPSFDGLDTKIKELVDVQITMKKKYVNRGYSEAKFYFRELSNNPYRVNKPNAWRPRLIGKTGKIIIDKVLIRKPNKRLCDLYEIKIAKRKQEVRLVSEKTIIANENKMSKAEMKTEKLIELSKEIANEKDDYNIEQLMAKYDLSNRDAKVVRHKLNFLQAQSKKTKSVRVAQFMFKHNKHLSMNDLKQDFGLSGKEAMKSMDLLASLKVEKAKKIRAAAKLKRNNPEEKEEPKKR